MHGQRNKKTRNDRGENGSPPHSVCFFPSALGFLYPNCLLSFLSRFRAERERESEVRKENDNRKLLAKVFSTFTTFRFLDFELVMTWRGQESRLERGGMHDGGVGFGDG